MYLQVFLKNTKRLLFLASVALIALAFAEWAAQFFGTSLVNYWYSSGRLLEIAATLLVYVVAVLLWEIREELRSNRS